VSGPYRAVPKWIIIGTPPKDISRPKRTKEPARTLCDTVICKRSGVFLIIPIAFTDSWSSQRTPRDALLLFSVDAIPMVARYSCCGHGMRQPELSTGRLAGDGVAVPTKAKPRCNGCCSAVSGSNIGPCERSYRPLISSDGHIPSAPVPTGYTGQARRHWRGRFVPSPDRWRSRRRCHRHGWPRCPPWKG
jgi:hypothetical protein